MRTSMRTGERAHFPRADRVPLEKASGPNRSGIRIDRWPAHVRDGKRRAREQIALPIAGAGVANRPVLPAGLDAFGDDRGAELGTKLDDTRHELTAARVQIEIGHKIAIELDEPWLEIGDPSEVRVSSAEVVDDEVHVSARAHFAQDVEAELEVHEWQGLGDLEKYVVIVAEDGIVGPHEP